MPQYTGLGRFGTNPVNRRWMVRHRRPFGASFILEGCQERLILLVGIRLADSEVEGRHVFQAPNPEQEPDYTPSRRVV